MEHGKITQSTRGVRIISYQTPSSTNLFSSGMRYCTSTKGASCASWSSKCRLILFLVFATQFAAAHLPRGLGAHLNFRAASLDNARLLLSNDSPTTASCKSPYGVLPCTDSVLGNLFLLAAYGFLLFQAARMLSRGSELLLAVLDAGLIGGLLLPVLGALPDSILILVSGLGGTRAQAQQQVLVGIGLLAGSNVMLLTLLWGSCLILGRCDLVKLVTGKRTALDTRLTKPFGLTDTGVEIDALTMHSAQIMVLSLLPFILAQLPLAFHFSATHATVTNVTLLAACVLALAGLVAYCVYQVFTPWLHQRRKRTVFEALALEALMKHSQVTEPLVDDNGELDVTVAEKLFRTADSNDDGEVSTDELGALLGASLVMRGHATAHDITKHLMTEFDQDRSRSISKEEFLKGMRKWCKHLELKHEDSSLEERRKHVESRLETLVTIKQNAEDGDREHQDAEALGLSTSKIVRKAILLLLGGTIVAAVFAEPLVDAVNDFSTATHIPSFFVSFVLLPLASNSSEAVSSIFFSARKKKENMSLTYSQIYGGVTMNNTMGLGIFLAVVYGRHLVWDFSSEVLVICLVTLVMGLLASFRKVFPLWMAGLSLLLYPASLGLVAILDYVAGWH